ncbi:MAG: hypothetical protein A3A73_01595 [Omnitrophica bacterium RIFCSPLOWO2_01_FULL_50_24]|nr:MAG: hypothetical protein A3A73_01595 [Omnitrophica bacterium RIFCSPLOWO2_01_FULL_50_24]
METVKSLDAWNAYMDYQNHRMSADKQSAEERTSEPFVTISRQTGAGGITVGKKLVEFLRMYDRQANGPWTVFDDNLVEEVLREHHLPEKFETFMAEESAPELQDTIEELFGLHPSKWTLVHKTAETFMRLAHLGNVVLVGRGACVVTFKLPLGIHVRLVGSIEKRAAHLQKYYGIGEAQAITMIRSEDSAKRAFLKKYFNKEINDPLIYDFMINTDLVSYEDTARLIGEEILRRRRS